MIKVSWVDDTKLAIRLEYSDPIESWEEYHNAVKEAYSLVRTQTHKVNMIHNPGKTQMPGGNAMAEIRRAIDTAPANTGDVFMVISNMFARRIMELMLKISLGAKNYHFVGTTEEALARTKAKAAKV